MSVQLQSRFLATLVVRGRAMGAFQGFEGGDVTGESVTSRPPLAEYPRKVGGEKNLEPITLTVDYDPTVHNKAYLSWLRQHVMVENAATVGRVPADDQRNPMISEGTNWIGIITSVSEPTSDNNETTAKAQLTVIVDPSGFA